MKIIEVNKKDPYYSFCVQGKKIIEGRLNKGKFALVEIGDIIKTNNETFFKVIGKKLYPTFKDMIISEGIENVTPDKKSINEAVSVYRQFYTPEQEKEFGIIAIKIKKINKVI
jgi:ASC-1-like (ASCH) protein